VWKKSRLARLQIIPFIIVHTLAVARYARDCDVIHAQWTLSAGSSRLSRIIHHSPIVVTLHGSDIFQVTQSWLGLLLTRWVLRGCDQIVAVSQALKEFTLESVAGSASIAVIPDGVNLNHFKPPRERRKPVILYVGSLIKRKGVVYLLEAMAKLTRSAPSLELKIIGDGPEKPELEEIAAQLGLGRRVSFLGFLPPDEVRQWMQRAKLFVLPSVEEGLGVVLLEALACGTPIVASRIGGIPEVLTPEVGILVPPTDVDALSEAILQALNDEEQWQEMSLNARKRAEEVYDWRKIGAQLIEIYRDALKDRGYNGGFERNDTG